MNIKQLFTDEQAVSPVIGVILMVAITVILAAVIGTFVLGLGSNIQQSAPQATFEISTNTPSPDTADAGNITHSTGDSIDAANLQITGDGAVDQGWDGSGTVSAGSSTTFDTTSGTGDATIRVVWNSPEGDNSATLQTFDITKQ